MAYADVTAALVTYLKTKHPTLTVASRVPSTRPSEWIQVREVGGAQARPVRDSVRVDIFYWHTSEVSAMAGAQLVRTEIHALAGTSTLGVTCYRVDEVLRPRPLDDELSGSPRGWATYTLLVRANDAIHASA